jgi:Ku70/Ku80 beta-barrel domain
LRLLSHRRRDRLGLLLLPAWQGHLRLPLVSCAVGLYRATTTAGDISFNLINPATGYRIKMITTDPVNRSSLVKGYAVEKNNYVLFSEEDFESVRLETTRTLEIERFVDADIAEIVTGVIAAAVGGRYLWLGRERRVMMENYLRAERHKDDDLGNKEDGVRSVLHLMGYIAMTEPEVLDAALASRNIRSFTSNDPETGRSNALLFQFEPRARQDRRALRRRILRTRPRQL